MYKEKVKLSIKNIKEITNTLIQVFENEDTSKRSFENWIFADTLNHIASWIKYSRELIENIQNSREVIYPENMQTFIERFNLENFNLKKHYNLQEAEKNIISELNEYEKAISQFSENEYLAKYNDLPIYKYIMIDLYIHPVQHFLYYSLIKNNFKSFKFVLEESEYLFMFYSKENYDVYLLKEFFENDELRRSAFKKFIIISNDDFVKKVIEINLKQ